MGVGCRVESCRLRDLRQLGLEQHCSNMIQTYVSQFPSDEGNFFDKATSYNTNGGYSSAIVVDEHFRLLHSGQHEDGLRRCHLVCCYHHF